MSNWTTAWQAEGIAGIQEGVHAGAAHRVDAAGEQRLVELLASDPQAAG